jgi:transcriptional regulator with XRE-family HTH domain
MMTEPRAVAASLSADVINLLHKRGMTLAALAEATGTTTSFMSRVKSRSRSLTIEDLVALEAAVGEPLPLLLLRASPHASIAPDKRSLFEATKRLLETPELDASAPRDQFHPVKKRAKAV